jgi:hypothetical protein
MRLKKLHGKKIVNTLTEVMPKLFEYLGIVIFFYSNEHDPVHVHGRYQGRESKAQIVTESGQITGIEIKLVKGKLPLQSSQLTDFNNFVEHYADVIVQKWIDYFVFNQQIEFERITRRIK